MHCNAGGSESQKEVVQRQRKLKHFEALPTFTVEIYHVYESSNKWFTFTRLWAAYLGHVEKSLLQKVRQSVTSYSSPVF
jgi:hypothetical protein